MMGRLLRRVCEIGASIGLVVLSCAILAARSPSSIRTPVQTFVELASGPIGGWVGAVRAGAFPEAFGSLWPMTFLTFAPLFRYATHRSLGALALGTLFWVVSGYLFSIAIGA
jgi:hypothetical protein